MYQVYSNGGAVRQPLPACLSRCVCVFVVFTAARVGCCCLFAAAENQPENNYRLHTHACAHTMRTNLLRSDRARSRGRLRMLSVASAWVLLRCVDVCPVSLSLSSGLPRGTQANQTAALKDESDSIPDRSSFRHSGRFRSTQHRVPKDPSVISAREK